MASYLIRINSGDRIYPSDTDSSFSINFSNSDGMRNVGAFLVKSVIIPHVFYNIQTGVNDQLAISVNAVPATTLTIPQGWYDITLMISTLQSSINTYLASLALTTTVAITLNPYTNKLVFTYTDGVNADTVRLLTTGSISRYLGISVNLTSTPDPYVGLSYSYTATDTPNLSGIRELYVNCNELGVSMMDPVLVVQNTICNVPVNANYGENIIFECQDEKSNIFHFNKPRNLPLLTFRIVNRDGNTVDMQNHRVRLILKFFTLDS